MEPPASWDLLTASLDLCERGAADRVWAYLVGQGLVRDAPGAGEKFAEIMTAARKACAGEPGPSAASCAALHLARDGMVLPAALTADPWGKEAIRRLEAIPFPARASLTADGLAHLRALPQEAGRGEPGQTLPLPAPAAEDPGAGAIQVPGYRVVRRAGAGSLLEEYEAVADGPAGERVLVQVPRHSDPEITTWFERVADLAGRLDHPSIPRRLAFGRTGDRPYLVLPWLPEEDLVRAVRQKGPLPAWEVARTIQGIAEALDYAHREGVVHGDLHPRRVRLTANGAVRVTGFGEFPPPYGLVGNLGHLAPEQLASPGQTTPASDVYALAGIAFFLLSGRFAFAAGPGTARDRAPAPTLAETQHGLPTAVAALLRRALAPQPLERRFKVFDWDQRAQVEWDDSGAFAQELHEVLWHASPPGSSKRWAWDYHPLPWLDALLGPASGWQEPYYDPLRLLLDSCDSLEPEERSLFLQPLLPALPCFLETLYSGDDLLTDYVVKLLSILGEPCLGMLGCELSRHQQHSLKNVYKALAACGGAGDVARVLADHSDPWERVSAAWALGEYGPVAVVVPALGDALRDAHQEVRRVAGEGLVRRLCEFDTTDPVERRAFVASCLELLSRDPAALRSASWWHLESARFLVPSSLCWICWDRRKYSAEARWMAAEALACLPPRRVEHPNLVEACAHGDPDARVRAAAARVVERLRTGTAD